MTGTFGIRINLRPFSVEPYGFRNVDGETVEKLKFIPAPDCAEQHQSHQLPESDGLTKSIETVIHDRKDR